MNPELAEKAAEVLGEIWVPTNAQHSHDENIRRSPRDAEAAGHARAVMIVTRSRKIVTRLPPGEWAERRPPPLRRRPAGGTRARRPRGPAPPDRETRPDAARSLVAARGGTCSPARAWTPWSESRRAARQAGARSA